MHVECSSAGDQSSEYALVDPDPVESDADAGVGKLVRDDDAPDAELALSRHFFGSRTRRGR